MASFIYFYSKFTEEFLLLSAAGVFSFLSIYCYHWVVRKRRLGAARDQVPAAMVKVYLNQLIGEAQFVRTQLFGLLGTPDASGTVPPPFNTAHFGIGNANPNAGSNADLANLPGELTERIKALENQLREKEGMVVNVNIEKSKLLEEIESLKQSQSSLPAGDTGASEELVKKIKALEERLEEYSVFEEDLANLKRLQQENTELKKRIEELLKGAGIAPSAPTAEAPNAPPTPSAPAPVAAAPAPSPAPELTPNTVNTPGVRGEKAGLDKNAIENLLDGVPAVPPSEPNPFAQTANQNPTNSPEPAVPNPFAKSAAPTPNANAPTPAIPPSAAATPATNAASPTNAPGASSLAAAPSEPSISPTANTKAGKDDFEKLVDSVEDSLNKPAPQAATSPSGPSIASNSPPVAAATTPPKPEGTPTVTKSDEELLKEFENLLNS